MHRVIRVAFMLSAIAASDIFTGAPASASVTEQFVGHARFEESRLHSHVALDPEIFVADANAPAAKGPLGISHIAGYRPARLADDASSPVYNAQGIGISLSLGRWLAASGHAEIFAQQEAAQGTRVNFTFTGLVPFGLYSIFISHSTPDGTVIVPFSDETDSITATINGYANVSGVSAAPLENGDVLLLVYHSDDQTHGDSRGDLGITAHDQLVLPVVVGTPSRSTPDAEATSGPEDQAMPAPSDAPATEAPPQDAPATQPPPPTPPAGASDNSEPNF